MNNNNTLDQAAGEQYRFAAVAMVLFAGLTLTFFNTLGIGFTSARAPALVAWFFASVAAGSFVFFTKNEKTNWAAVLFFVLFLFIVIRQGPKPTHSTGMGLIVLTMACAAHAAVLLARNFSWACVLAGAVVWVAVLNALVALYQYVGWSALYPIPYIEITPQGIAIGQVRQRNQMAILCVLGLVALAYFPAQFRRIALLRYLLGVCLIAAVAASASRIGALAVLLFSCTLLFTFRSLAPSAKWLVALAFPVFVILAVLLPFFVEGSLGLFSRLTDDAFAVPCNSRRLLWSNALDLIWHAPWAGAGWGGFISEYYMSDLPARGCEMIDHAHNVYLQFAVEAGLPAALLLILVSLWFFAKYWRVMAANDVYRWAYFSIAMIWLYAQTDFPLWEPGFLWLFAMFLGMMASRELAVVQSDKLHFLQRLAVPVKSWVVVAISLATACLSVMALVQFLRVSAIQTSTDWEREIRAHGFQKLSRENWMFSPRLEFILAQFQRPSAADAKKINSFCQSVMTYSPDAPIAMCVIRSAYLMGDMKQVEFHKQRLLTIYRKEIDMYRDELDSYK